MIIKELSNKELVRRYKEAKKVFIKTDLLGKEETEAENTLDLLCNEIGRRNLNLRNYINQ